MLLLDGAPGAEQIRASHVKQPADQVGPLKLTHDHEMGETSVEQEKDPLKALRGFEDWVSAKEFAYVLFASADRSDIEKARRKLQILEEDGFAERRKDGTGYRATESRGGR